MLQRLELYFTLGVLGPLWHAMAAACDKAAIALLPLAPCAFGRTPLSEQILAAAAAAAKPHVTPAPRVLCAQACAPCTCSLVKSGAAKEGLLAMLLWAV